MKVVKATEKATEKQLSYAELLAENTRLKAQQSGSDLQGTYSVIAGIRTITVSFICQEPKDVLAKEPSAIQGTRGIATQHRGGQHIAMPAADTAALQRDYGLSDCRLLGNIGIR